MVGVGAIVRKAFTDEAKLNFVKDLMQEVLFRDLNQQNI